MHTLATLLRSVSLPRLAPLIVLGAMTVATSACRDAGAGGPLGVVLTEETRGALSLGLEVPSLPHIVDRSTDAGDLDVGDSGDEWTGRWEASWLMRPARGREARWEVYDEAVGPLARSLGPQGVRSTLTDVEEAARAAEGAELDELPPLYRARVEEARELVDWGFRTLDEGHAAAALRAALEAADRIRTVSPEGVARVLLDRAHRASEDLSEHSAEERERIQRLVQGAEAALGEGDHRRAIQRAFYACQLLGVRLQ